MMRTLRDDVPSSYKQALSLALFLTSVFHFWFSAGKIACKSPCMRLDSIQPIPFRNQAILYPPVSKS